MYLLKRRLVLTKDINEGLICEFLQEEGEFVE